MRRIVIIVFISVLVVALIATSMAFNGTKAEITPVSTQTPAATGAVSIIVWSAGRDQKVFESSDASVVGAVSGLMDKAAWSYSTAPPSANLVKRQLILSVYDEKGKASQYTLYDLTDAGILLISQQKNVEGGYNQASFPAQKDGKSLADYLKISGQ